MWPAKSWKNGRAGLLRTLTAVAASSVTIAVTSLAAVPTAEAATTLNGCTVQPYFPTSVDQMENWGADYPTFVKCNPLFDVQVVDSRWEDSEYLGQTIYTKRGSFFGLSTTIHDVSGLRQRPQYAKVYHYVAFRTSFWGGTWSGWTKWEMSGISMLPAWRKSL